MKYGVFVCEKMSFLPIDVNRLELVKYPVDVGSLVAINNWIYEICLSPCKVEAEVIGSRTNGCICNYQLKKLYICVFAYLAWLFSLTGCRIDKQLLSSWITRGAPLRTKV